jgi:ABC-2 type transport system permease protein
MSRPNPLWELTLARIYSFLREPEALFWVFGFPILMAVGLGIAFREGDQAQPAVVAVERGSVAERWVPALTATPELAVRVTSADSAERMLSRGDAALALGGTDTLVFRYDPARAESRTARLLADAAVQGAAGVTPAVPVRETPERRRGGRYIDWVIPGLIGMNLMSTGMWGVGFGLVQMRQRKQLKRLSSTPMRRRDFLLAQVLARMTFVLVEVPPIILFAWLAFGVEVAGSALALAGVVALGGMTFAGLGLLTSSRASTIEGISGLLNVGDAADVRAVGRFLLRVALSRRDPAVHPRAAAHRAQQRPACRLQRRSRRLRVHGRAGDPRGVDGRQLPARAVAVQVAVDGRRTPRGRRRRSRSITSCSIAPWTQ